MLTLKEYNEIMVKKFMPLVRKSIVTNPPDEIKKKLRVYNGLTPMTKNTIFWYNKKTVVDYRSELLDILSYINIRNDGGYNDVDYFTYEDIITDSRDPHTIKQGVFLADNLLNMMDLAEIIKISGDDIRNGYGLYGRAGLYGIGELIVPVPKRKYIE